MNATDRHLWTMAYRQANDDITAELEDGARNVQDAAERVRERWNGALATVAFAVAKGYCDGLNDRLSAATD